NNLPPVTVPTNSGPQGLVAGSVTEYTIARGDNFTTIGKKFGVTAKAIQDANPGVDPLKIRPGQKLHIPAPAPTASGGATTTLTMPEMSTGATGETTYKVQSGDTFTILSKKFGVTVNALRAANPQVTSDRSLRVGQVLKIPAKTAPTV